MVRALFYCDNNPLPTGRVSVVAYSPHTYQTPTVLGFVHALKQMSNRTYNSVFCVHFKSQFLAVRDQKHINFVVAKLQNPAISFSFFTSFLQNTITNIISIFKILSN
jgi:hypothetical protein